MCRSHINESCPGCKTGYADGQRNIRKSRCDVKVCCIGKGLKTCADCSEFNICGILDKFYSKKGKIRYRPALEFIRKYGYEEFEKKARNWKYIYGELS